ncbi:hypothetical protein Afe04nite_48710 [Asanoa ferruginea]|nr:hypothetical protein Afe04nite_48710 [Asanoa ferruginea]
MPRIAPGNEHSWHRDDNKACKHDCHHTPAGNGHRSLFDSPLDHSLIVVDRRSPCQPKPRVTGP